MERREFLRIAAGAAAGLAAFATGAQAAPLMPPPSDDGKLPQNPAQPAVTSKEEADGLQPEEVRWGRGRGRGWGRRRWGWRRRYWRRRRWYGWRRRRWYGWRRRRRWRRRYWRRRRYYW
jgi:hypothetical protein